MKLESVHYAILHFRFQRQQTNKQKKTTYIEVPHFYFDLKGISVPTGKRNNPCSSYGHIKYKNFS